MVDPTHDLDSQRAMVRDAVADGIRAAVSDPALWGEALSAMQAHAQQQAGGWLFGWLRMLASKALLFVVVGLGVYALGGWSALAAFFKTTAPP